MTLLAAIARIFGFAQQVAAEDEEARRRISDLRKRSGEAGRIADEAEAQAKALRDRGGQS